MLNVDLSKLIKNDMSRYALVTGTAKRARQISDEAQENGIKFTEKPVSLVVKEIEDGTCTIRMPSDNED